MLKPIKNADGNIEIRWVTNSFIRSRRGSESETKTHQFDRDCADVLTPSEAMEFFDELNDVVSEGKG